MIIQAVLSWRPGKLGSVNIIILSFVGGKCWMLSYAVNNSEVSVPVDQWHLN